MYTYYNLFMSTYFIIYIYIKKKTSFIKESSLFIKNSLSDILKLYVLNIYVVAL